ncbi:hypothetical protein [Agromyces silvae]|uniref:hypothetical protein n=1 Tax=Agromyces silvae TaxID=3388266 RepID=UPI00280C0068|nr:hypothetical protein [Agromyces protaetiae]
MQRRITTRVLPGLCAVVLGACALGSAAPAQAAETTPPAPPRVATVNAAGPAYSSPRLNTAVAAQLQAGELVSVFCGFTNAGLEWVKIFAHDSFGFVQSSRVAGGASGLPGECPNEIESIDLPAPGMSFGSPAWGVPLEGFTCPSSYPFLDNRPHTPPEFLDGVLTTFLRGVQIERTTGVAVDLGRVVPVNDPLGTGEYVGGYTGGSITNYVAWVASAKITATCTKNVIHAQRA